MSGSKGLQVNMGEEIEKALIYSLTRDAMADNVRLLNAALRRAKAEGLKEAEQYALNCVKELQDKIKDIELGKYTLVGAQTKEGVAEWVHAKTLQASRIAKWITARIAEVEDDARAAQIEALDQEGT